MAASNPFRRIEVRSAQSCDIESLFKDLKNRSPKIRELLAPQADVLRDYQKNFSNVKDVSIELPTGSGKTLVGLLIAEYRRKILGERILYLCPTKQLANQVGNKSKEYDISTRVLVGSKKAFNRDDVNSYRSAASIAITTYSGLFNTNPEFEDPQTIILDDAHGGESYISSLWSLEINRDKNSQIYSAITALFEKDLPNIILVLNSPTKPKSLPRPELIPFAVFYKNMEKIKKVLNDALSPEIPDLYFPWQFVRDGLQACQVYISWDLVLIRPYIAPTLVHRPFSQANQRIYMSATLGSGGELERITGINKILRMSTPKTYEKRGVGRRLFLFPDAVSDAPEYESWLAKLISSSERTLALCPTKPSMKAVNRIIEMSPSPPKILGASDIESSLKPFSSSKPVVLSLANRYDGIDIPSEECRLLVMYGLPTGTNLQESFLEDKLGLDVLLRERVKTRISQGSGRCTRSDTDSSAVIMIGRRLLDFCIKRENQLLFHNEVRAELDYALRLNPKDLESLTLMLKSFYNKDENWDVAEKSIGEIRDYDIEPDKSLTNILDSIVKDEVNFVYSMWSDRFKDAVKLGIAITDRLVDSRLGAYRALWFYFTACAAHATSKDDNEYSKIAEKQMSRAINSCKTVSWFATALRSMIPEEKVRSVADELETIATEGITYNLKDLGSKGPGFMRKMTEVEKMLGQINHSQFDRGMMELGLLLGFNAWTPDSQAEPDCVWQLGNEIAYLLEGKSEENPEGPISVEDCRQASGHLKWARMNQQLKNCKTIYSILVTPRTVLDKAAIPHATDIYLMKPMEMKSLFDRTNIMLTSIRSTMIDEADDELKEKVLSEMVSCDLTPRSIQILLLSKPATGAKPKEE